MASMRYFDIEGAEILWPGTAEAPNGGAPAWPGLVFPGVVLADFPSVLYRHLSLIMEQRKPPEYLIEVFADPTCIKDVVREPELETLIDTRVGQLVRQLNSTSSPKSSIRGTLTVHFFEKKRRKGSSGLGWFTTAKGDEEICWEKWTLEVTLATPRTEDERIKVMRAIGSSLQKTAMNIVTIVNRDKEHIPLITTYESNPFPYSIDINPRVEGWGKGIGMF
ncbi:uncharacterized protein KY384_003741 [Bacidia gigantensis]|uniref:uncharacterized protein n=1 Tax=Bacidia gigantensis TaxID=2732470 RepID=UPI001D03A653|nr:uncharacterized protein KY384_003741 [Bacidia gigantensis]KAG8532104.1 hypothetical protein KY384_003741 [Bacidia gigantensis]